MKVISIVCGLLGVLAFTTATSAMLSGKNRPEDEFEAIAFTAGTFVIPVVLLAVSIFLWLKQSGPPARMVDDGGQQLRIFCEERNIDFPRLSPEDQRKVYDMFCRHVTSQRR